MNMIDLINLIADYMATDIDIGPERQFWACDEAVFNLNEFKILTGKYLANVEKTVILNCDNFADYEKFLRTYNELEANVECLIMVGQELIHHSYLEEHSEILTEKQELAEQVKGIQRVYNDVEKKAIDLSIELEKGLSNCYTTEAVLNSGCLEKLRLENIKQTSKILELLKDMGTIERTPTPSRSQSPIDVFYSISTTGSSSSSSAS